MEDEKKEVVTSDGITDKFGDTEQSLATEEAVRIGNKYLMHDGSLAAHDIAERKARGKAADERIRKALGDVGFEDFKQRTADAQSARDEQFEKMARTNILHGLVAAHKNANESACNEQIELDTMGSAAETLGVAHDAEQNVEDMQNKLAWVTTTRDHMFHAIDARTDWDDARKQKEKDAVELAVSAHNTAYALAFGVKESDIEARRASTAIKQTVGLSDAVKKCFERGYSFCKTAGGDHEMCYAKGMEEARNFSLRYFKERIARGNIREVLTQLDYLESKSDAMFQDSRVKRDKNGKPILDAKGNNIYGDDGVFDPSQMLFCRFEDFNELRNAANVALSRAEQYNNIRNAKRLEDFKLADAGIRMRADKLSLAPVLDIDKMNELMKSTERMLSKGFADADKTSKYLTDIIKSAERKYSKAQKDSKKLQTVDDFEREYREYMDKLKESAPMAWFAKNGQIEVHAGEYADVAADVDGQNRLILLIRNGQSRGILKGDVWNNRLRKLEEGRASEDYDAALSLMADSGIEVDTEASKSLRTAYGGDVAKKTGETLGDAVLKSMWAKDDTGRLKLENSKYMMYNWNDPKTGRKVPLTGDELNQVLGLVSEWQRRHVNPSPNGTYSPELKEYVTGVLRDAARRKTISHWFSSDENDIPFGFSDIENVGRSRMRAYFAGEQRDKTGKKVYNIRSSYNRDMSILESAALDGALPTQSEMANALRARITESEMANALRTRITVR